MDHQPLKLEAIKHEKARLSTFKKRKSSLMKKAHELKTLCDVEVCIIIYGPKLKNLSVQPETWASEEGKLNSIIRRYKKTISTADDVQQRTTCKNKTPQVEDDAVRPNKKRCVANNYTTWDERMDRFTEDQLKMILGTMDNKLKVADQKLNVIKGDQNVMRKAASRKLDHASHSAADSHQQYDARPLNLELAINLQPNDQVCQKLPSYSSLMKIPCGGKSGSSIPYTALQGRVYCNHRPSYNNQIISPEPSGVYDENGAPRARKSSGVLKDQSGKEE